MTLNDEIARYAYEARKAAILAMTAIAPSERKFWQIIACYWAKQSRIARGLPY